MCTNLANSCLARASSWNCSETRVRKRLTSSVRHIHCNWLYGNPAHSPMNIFPVSIHSDHIYCCKHVCNSNVQEAVVHSSENVLKTSCMFMITVMFEPFLPYIQLHTVYSIPYSIFNSIQYFQLHAVYSGPYSIFRSIYYVQIHTAYSTPKSIFNSIQYIQLHPVNWTPCSIFLSLWTSPAFLYLRDVEDTFIGN